MNFLLRVEAVNLGQFVYDTEDLSTIRGGGLMLLNSPENIKNFLTKTAAKTVVTVMEGASQCLFQFESTDAKSAETIRLDVESRLRADPNFGHATFVVDVVPVSKDFRKDQETLLAKNRWRQLEQLRLGPLAESDASEACKVDLVKPANASMKVKTGDKAVHESILARHTYGRTQKRKFYKAMCAELDSSIDAAWDFHEISARGPNRFGEDAKSEDPYSQLNDKLAVIYIDGNSFGKLQQQYVKDVTSQKAWDEHIQKFRREVLQKLIGRINATGLHGDRWRCNLTKPARTVARLETLLWGGDELIWVVPAWQGLATVRLFFGEAKESYKPGDSNTKSPAAPSTYGTIPAHLLGSTKKVTAPSITLCANGLPVLTHACGMVFCHADTPIQGVIKLSKELAETAKKANNKIDSVNYAVLESFDALGDEIDAVRKKHLPEGIETKQLIIPASDLNSLDADLRTMTAKFPRGSVYKILKAFQNVKVDEYDTLIERAKREAGVLPDRFPAKFDSKDVKLANWLHLAELWDYLGERGEGSK